MKEKISIIGLGRLGLTFALVVDATKKYEVYGYEINKERSSQIKEKTLKTNEPQLEELLVDSNLYLMSNLKDTCDASDLLFLFVATPSLENGSYSHEQIEGVIKELEQLQVKNKTLIINCTTLPGYCKTLQERLKSLNINVLYNPEFIAQFEIVKGLQNADIVLIGGENIPEEVFQLYRDIQITKPIFKTLSLTGAELTKVAINCFLNLKIAYANLIGSIAIESGEEGKITEILEAVGSDSRIGNKFLGYGFPASGLCILPTQDIITKRGVIQIKDIQIGDWVLTHKGVWNKVTEIFKRGYEGKLCKFQLEGFAGDYLVTTPEHPIFACQKVGARYYLNKGKKKLKSMEDKHYEQIQPSFIEAKDLQHADFLCIPKLNTENLNKKYLTFTHESDEFSSNIELTPDIMRLFGYYLAEGCVDNGTRVCFSFHEKEVDFHKDVILLLQKYFNFKAFTTKSKTKAVQIRGTSHKLGKFINDTFGKGAANKKIPYEWLELSDEHLIELLRGMWYGDGSNSYRTFTYATISKELFTFTKLILYRLRICFHTHIAKEKTDKNGVNHKQAYFIEVNKKAGVEAFNKIIPLKAIPSDALNGAGYIRGDKRTTIWKDEILYYHIRQKQNIDYKGEVYNIEVENDNSYMLTSSVVHNCIPRDIRALNFYANTTEIKTNFITELNKENDRHLNYLRDFFISKNPDKSVPFVFSHITYKKGTDILTESKQLELCLKLLRRGYVVSVPYETIELRELPKEFIEFYEKDMVLLDEQNGYKVN